MNLATKGTIMVSLNESQRGLLLSTLQIYLESLNALSRLRPDANIQAAWNEAIALKRLLEGAL